MVYVGQGQEYASKEDFDGDVSNSEVGTVGLTIAIDVSVTVEGRKVDFSVKTTV
jgi:hypothetical protein